MSLFSGILKKTLTETAEKAAKEAVEKAAKEAAEKTIKEAAEKTIKEAAEKTIKEAAEKTVKEASEKTVKESAEKAAKEAAEKTAQETAEKTGKEVGEKTGMSSLKKAGIVAGGLAATGVAAYTFIDPVVEMNRKNSTTYTIIKIEDNSSLIDTSAALISISPGEKISLNDTITIVDSDSRPSVDGSYKPSKIISDSQFEIVIPSHILTNGTHGKMTLKTDYNTQLSQTTQAEAGVVTNVLGGVGSVVGNVVGGVGSGLLSGLGINYVWIIVIIILILLSSSSIIAMKI
jgi:hypothetical protein